VGYSRATAGKGLGEGVRISKDGIGYMVWLCHIVTRICQERRRFEESTNMESAVRISERCYFAKKARGGY
jgi:hypothetical protein